MEVTSLLHDLLLCGGRSGGEYGGCREDMTRHKY